MLVSVLQPNMITKRDVIIIMSQTYKYPHRLGLNSSREWEMVAVRHWAGELGMGGILHVG